MNRDYLVDLMWGEEGRPPRVEAMRRGKVLYVPKPSPENLNSIKASEAFQSLSPEEQKDASFLLDRDLWVQEEVRRGRFD